MIDHFELTPEGKRSLAIVEAALVAAVLEALEGAGENQAEVAAVALDPGQEEELLGPLVGVHRTLGRTEAHRRRGAAAGWEEYWLPEPEEDDDLFESDLEETSELSGAWTTLVAEVNEVVLEPIQWILARVAYRLNREVLPVQAAEDLVVFVAHPDFGHALICHIELVARPEALRSLRTRGFLS